MEDLESKQLELEQLILDLSLERLMELATHLEIVVAEGDGRLKVLRNVRRTVEEKVESSEDKLSVVNQIIAFIGQPPAAQQNTEYTKAKEDLERMQAEFAKAMAIQQKQIEEATAKLSALQEPATKTVDEQQKTPESDNDKLKAEALWRREFKIIGSIGGEKDKLSYVGLMRQVDCGLDKGYKEGEIIEAVIRCINPSTKLKSYLEIMKELTLQKLCHILRVHYQEKTASELYQELTSIVQGPKESPQDFLLRSLSLRERILFVSKAEEKGMKYDTSLVQSLFTHAFETGLREEAIRSKIRDILHKDAVTDEELMGSLNKIVSIEEERQNKLRVSQSKNAKECRVNSLNTTGNADAPVKPSTKQGNASLLTTLECLQAQVTELNAKFENSRRESASVNNAPRNQRYRRRKCQSCQDHNVAQCDHCFKCGSIGHMARGCQSGNGQMLPPRDRE